MSYRVLEAQSTDQVLSLLPPFPIVLVTTRSNIITIGQIEYFTFSPLRIGIAVAHTRYTYSLLKHEREFVINVPDAKLIDVVKLCGSMSGREGNKFKAAEVSPEASLQVQAVSIAECPAHIECTVEREIEFEKRTWFVGRVVSARCEEGFDGRCALLCDRHEYVIPGATIAER